MPLAGTERSIAQHLPGLRNRLDRLRSLTWISHQESHLGFLDVVGTLAFNLGVTAALGYGYFHLNNLGETARRVRILRELLEAGGKLSDAEILERYNAAVMVDKRLHRLTKSGQIQLRDGRLFAHHSSVVLMAKIMDHIKWLLTGRAGVLNPSTGTKQNLS